MIQAKRCFKGASTMNHEKLADTLMNLVEEEHRAIRSFELEQYTALAHQRAAVCQQIIDLAAYEPIPRAQADQCRWANTVAEENMRLLQDAQQVMQGMIKRLTGKGQATTYTKAGGRPSRPRPGSAGMMVWKG